MLAWGTTMTMETPISTGFKAQRNRLYPDKGVLLRNWKGKLGDSIFILRGRAWIRCNQYRYGSKVGNHRYNVRPPSEVCWFIIPSNYSYKYDKP